jgi:putative iron-dependent peroxidase
MLVVTTPPSIASAVVVAVARVLFARRAGHHRTESDPMTMSAAAESSSPVPQPVTAPLTRAAIFLVVTINPGADNCATVCSLCADLATLLRAVGFREADENLSCVMAFGSAAWDRLFGEPRPAELHPFREIRVETRHAVATSGDILFHIRAEPMGLCFELAAQIMARLGDAVAPADEVHGFRYFDRRDLLGFVDGTENPTAQEAVEATVIGDEDPAFVGGSYVIVQKYLHDLAGWNALPTEAQEHIIGRMKLSDIEIDESVRPSSAHNSLTKIVEDGKEIKIVRDNMAFGQAGQGEFGTYFIGYSRSPRTIEQMLENMFIGRPPGNYDRILDFSRAVTGNLFFAPSATFLEEIAPDAPSLAEPAASPAVEPSSQPVPSVADGSLGIGSLKGKPRS